MKSFNDETFIKLVFTDPNANSSFESEVEHDKVEVRLLQKERQGEEKIGSLQLSFFKKKKVLESRIVSDKGEVRDIVRSFLKRKDSSKEGEEGNTFSKASLVTKFSECELKLRKGKGKLKEWRKDDAFLDYEKIVKTKLTTDVKVNRKILEDRRLLLLTDPKNLLLKQLYAEAKRAIENIT